MNTIGHPKAMLYPKAHWSFAGAILVTWTGFSRSYFGRLTQTHVAHHLHGLSAEVWLGILVAKPVRYQRGRLRLHRQLTGLDRGAGARTRPASAEWLFKSTGGAV